MESNITTSVIVPVFNDPLGILTTLNSLVSQKFDEIYEIIIVDNNSTDNTYETIKNFIKNNKNKTRAKIKLLQENKKSSYATRNKGIKHSQGELLCFLDSDMWVDDSYLQKIYSTYRSSKTDYFYLGCNVKIIMDKKNVFEKTNLLTGFPIKKYINKGHFAPTCCLITNRAVIKKVGIFNDNLVSGGDWEFGQRVYRNNIQQRYGEKITVYHPARKTFASLFKKHYRFGRGLCQLSKSSTYNFYWKILSQIIPSNPLKFINNERLYFSFLEYLKIYVITYIGINLPIFIGYHSGLFIKNEKF